MYLPTPQHTRYQLVRLVGTEAVGKTFLVRDTQVADAALRILQQLDLHSQDESLSAFGQTLLLHRAQTLQDIFDNLSQTGTLHSYFVDGQSFYLVQAVIRGVSWVRRRFSASLAVRQQQVLTLLQDMLMLLQQVYDQGLQSCCLYPNDIVWQPSHHRCVWTGMGVFKAISQQIRQTELPLESFFPGDSQGYFAPEFHQGSFHHGSDLYTLGMVSIQTLLQQPLSAWMQATDDGGLTVAPTWHRTLGLATDWAQLLNGLTRIHPSQRYQSPIEVLQDLKDLTPVM
ncbi:MAG: hypothetical protein AAFZ80_07280 [Cyanobacteria bacterium P01_A01_bin.105]